MKRSQKQTFILDTVFNIKKIIMNRKIKLFRNALLGVQVLLLAFSTMWFDDEIKGWWNRTITPIVEQSTKSPNVTVHTDMVTITGLDRKRSLHIYTPSDYQTSGKRYPVMYMFDAHRLFDVKTTSRDEEGIDEFLDAAIANGEQELIIVAIEASSHRSTEMNPYDSRNNTKNEADIFMRFIVEELKPMIDEQYRTLPDRKNTGIMGASLGGLMSFYTIMHYPNIFSKAGVLSPSFLHSEKVFDLPNSLSNSDIKIYMNVGEQEFVGMKTVFHLMEQQLQNNGFTDQHLKTKIVAGGGHEAKVWSDGFAEAYDWFWK